MQASVIRPFKDIFHNGGFINMVTNEEDTNEDELEDEGPNFVTPGVVMKNWTTVDVPSCVHISK